ncbi:MAG TPA: hypothetical protein VNW52_10750 [Burkholderiaceae bacterium]|jgi:hypothetical protein|nr:hypothetical protein [Burkholderiaceae bacterium]
MTTSKRAAFLLAITVHILLLYALSKSGGHLLRSNDASKPLFVTLFLPHPIAEAVPSPRKQEVPTRDVSKRTVVAHSVAPATAPAVAAIVVAPKEAATTPTANPNGALLAQSALNAIGKLDQDERRSAAAGANVMSNSLSARLTNAIDKHASAKAGAIDENIYPDGRREERVHTLFGGEYCITYESPSNPVDGFDIMQRGMKPSVPHSCGHRFD